MVAVGRRDHGEVGQPVGEGALADVARRRPLARGRLDPVGRQPQHRVGAAERLEAAQPEARALVLVVQGGDAELTGEPVQSAQRRRRVAGPAGDLARGRVGHLGGEHRVQRVRPRLRRRRPVDVVVDGGSKGHRAAS